jgi:hypothetical protein
VHYQKLTEGEKAERKAQRRASRPPRPPRPRQLYRPPTADGARRHRAKRLWRLYKLTLGQYNAMGDAQGWVCAICRQPQTQQGRGEGQNLCVDHVHDSQPVQVRGLLCHDCNTAIGKFHESVGLLKAAVRYMTSFVGPIA